MPRGRRNAAVTALRSHSMSKHAIDKRLRPVQHAATNPFRFGALRSTVAVLLAILLFFVSAVGFLYGSLAAQVRHSALDISNLTNQSGSTAKAITAIDQFQGRAINILVSGTDSRYNQDDAGYGSSEELATIHSDTTMIAHISADRKSVTVVSIPRDLVTDIPSCTLSSGETTASYEGMFNSAFSTGAVTDDVGGGIACTKATVEQLTGLTIDAFVVVDFTGFKGMIEALGGVWFNVPEDMYDTYSGLDVKAGCQRFDAATALSFARARYEVGDGSDISRIGRQQQLVSAMLREVLSKNYVTDLPALITFLRATIASLTVSTNLADINADAGLLSSFLGVDKANIRFVTMPWGLASWDRNRVVAIEPDATNIWEALAADQPLPVGTAYTDGAGNTQTVPDPEAQSAAAAESGTASDTGSTSDTTTTTETTNTTDTTGSTDTGSTATTSPETCPPSE